MNISIIMAVYNGEAFLDRALQSFLAQNSENWELICVDDGSNDSSAEIINQYAQIEPRIRLLQQENSGTARARITGYRAATGDFVFCGVDQDDYVEPDFVRKLSQEASTTDADVILCDWMVERQTGKFVSFWHGKNFGIGDQLMGMQAFDATFPWRIHAIGLWSRSLVEEFAIDERYAFNNYDADEYLSRLIVLNANKVYLGAAKYFHCVNPRSLTSEASPKMVYALETNEKLLFLADRIDAPAETIRRILLFQRNKIAMMFSIASRFPDHGKNCITPVDFLQKVDRHFFTFRNELRKRRSAGVFAWFRVEAIIVKLRLHQLKFLLRQMSAKIFRRVVK